jgi:hypothetical protein
MTESLLEIRDLSLHRGDGPQSGALALVRWATLPGAGDRRWVRLFWNDVEQPGNSELASWQRENTEDGASYRV